MALVTAQKRQALRLPTPDLSVDSIDQLALLGVFQVETIAPSFSAAAKRQVLRLPTVDATVDSDDAYGFLQLPQSTGTGPTVDTFSLAWTIDPTFSLSESTAAVSGSASFTLGQFIAGIQGVVLDSVQGPVISLGFLLTPRRIDLVLDTRAVTENVDRRTLTISMVTRRGILAMGSRRTSADFGTRKVVVA